MHRAGSGTTRSPEQRNLETGRTELRLAITGVTGRVGLLLVPLLVERGVEVVLVGRDAARLQAAFPDKRSFSYEQLPAALAGCDAVVHLATLNTDSAADPGAFHQTNVAFAV